jgi:hypothetical protein
MLVSYESNTKYVPHKNYVTRDSTHSTYIANIDCRTFCSIRQLAPVFIYFLFFPCLGAG